MIGILHRFCSSHTEISFSHPNETQKKINGLNRIRFTFYPWVIQHFLTRWIETKSDVAKNQRHHGKQTSLERLRYLSRCGLWCGKSMWQRQTFFIGDSSLVGRKRTFTHCYLIEHLTNELSLNSSPPSGDCMRQWTRWKLIQVLACRLLGAKPSPEPNADLVHWTLRNKLQLNLNQNTKLFIHKNAFENVACEMAAILTMEGLVNRCGWNILSVRLIYLMFTLIKPWWYITAIYVIGDR